jgi:hypothetical protein
MSGSQAHQMAAGDGAALSLACLATIDIFVRKRGGKISYIFQSSLYFELIIDVHQEYVWATVCR